MQTYTLFDLLEHLRRVIALNYPEALWITAEVAQISRSRGHLYLDLVQKGAGADSGIAAQAQAVIWQREYQKLRLAQGIALEEVLHDGREVRLLARVDFHERYGLKLLITDVDPAYTFGQIELRRRQTIDTLRALGLLERNRALPLPAVLQRIAVVSSEGAAGFQDFREHLAANAFGYRFQCRLFSSAVQGDNADPELIAALETIAAQRDRFDCAVILRGGGARTDLAAFDRLNLCKIAATLPLPLFTGIGHDADESVLDMVAHTALKTPTAVADFLIQHNLFFENNILRAAGQVRETAAYHLKVKTLELHHLEGAARWSAQGRTRSAKQQVEQISAALPALARRQLLAATRQLEQAETLCAALHPEAALRRGFSLTLKDGKVVTAATEVQPGDMLDTRLREGSVRSVVKGAVPAKEAVL